MRDDRAVVGFLDQRMTRRRFGQVAGASALATLIASCTGTASGPSAGGSAAPSAGASGATKAPVRGGTLVYARNLDAKTLDPHFSAQLSERYVLYLIFNTLVAYDKDFNIVPDLARSWDISSDKKSITFHLQPGAKFHDGTACDATAVKFSLDRVVDPAVNSPLRGQLVPPLSGVEVVDKATVRINTSMAWRPLLAALGERPGFIVSPAAVQKYGKDFGRNPVGSGPFKFVEWTPDSRVVVERFDGYWDPGKPYLDRIEVRHVPDSQVRLTMIRTGEAQLIDSVTPALVPTLQSASGVTVAELQSGRFWGVQMPNKKAPFNNADLRKALAYATDREAVRKVAFAGTGRLATHPLGAGWAYERSLDSGGYAFDLDKAKAALKDANLPAGTTLLFQNSDDRQQLDIAQALASTYGQIGLKIQQQAVPAADSFGMLKQGKIDWTLTNWAPRADPDGLLRILWYSKGFQNTTAFSDPEVDRLLDEAAGEFDTTKAKPLYTKAEQIIVANADYDFMLWPSEFAAYRSEVGNFVYHPDLILRMRDLFIAK
ncbi:MAG: hypothetical protein KGN00_09785 [Chloroflexota bacterium]|nr:hypothetical protein [Chloroflexota bacterium]MDE3193965.1 hypothetical protein [Chloroflexota bacterium]